MKRRDSPDESLSDDWIMHPDPHIAVTHAVPHTVVSQILRPELAAFLVPVSITMRTKTDAVSCVSEMRLRHARKEPRLSASCDFAHAFHHLTALNFSSTSITSAFLRKITAPLSLQLVTLTLHGCDTLDPSELGQCLAELPALRSLYLNAYAPMSSPVFTTAAANGSALEKLTVCGCQGVGSGVLAVVSEFSHLRMLDLTGCTSIRSPDLQSIGKLTSLEFLDLSWCSKAVDAAALAHLRALTNLRTLSLHGCHKVDAAGLAHLVQLEQLAMVSAVCCGLVRDTLRNSLPPEFLQILQT